MGRSRPAPCSLAQRKTIFRPLLCALPCSKEAAAIAASASEGQWAEAENLWTNHEKPREKPWEKP